MELQEVMKQIEEADLSENESKMFLMFLTGYLGQNDITYNMEIVVNAFKSALDNQLKNRNH